VKEGDPTASQLGPSGRNDFPVVPVPIVHGRNARDSPENRAERLDVGIAHAAHHFIDVFPARLETLFCRFDFDPLNVFPYRVAGGLLESMPLLARKSFALEKRMKEPSMQPRATAPLGTRMDMCFIGEKVITAQCRSQPLKMSDLHPPRRGSLSVHLRRFHMGCRRREHAHGHFKRRHTDCVR
jgi:hypothetical protein